MTTTPKILAVDTAAFAGSVALAHGDTLVAESLLNVRSTHSEKLLKQIDLLLAEAGWPLTDIELLAVVVGPGSFTGLRIGLATVKGLAQTLNVPVASVSALEVSALGFPSEDVPVCAFLDARKKEVYTQIFKVGEQGPVATSDARVVAPEVLLGELTGTVGFVGDGVPVYQHLIKEKEGLNALLAPHPCHQRRGGQVAWLAYQRWLEGVVDSATEVTPVYIRPSDAELNFSSKNKRS